MREHPVLCVWCRRSTFADSAVCTGADCRRRESTFQARRHTQRRHWLTAKGARALGHPIPDSVPDGDAVVFVAPLEVS